MPRPPITQPTTNEHGDEEHPSFGVVRLSRITSTPGIRLFDSSVPHGQYVRMEIARATRRRDLHHDWIYGDTRTLIELDMSLSQWGALVSSFNMGSGTPCTLHRVDGVAQDQAPHESRLASTADEVARAAQEATERILAAAQAVTDAYEAKAGRRDMGEAVKGLRHAVESVPSNMKYAATRLAEHAEEVVAKATTDIEAARQFGAKLLPAGVPLELAQFPVRVDGAPDEAVRPTAEQTAAYRARDAIVKSSDPSPDSQSVL